MSDGINITVTAIGLTSWQNRLRRWARMAPIGAGEATAWTAAYGVIIVQHLASGRPGPNVETGQYRASIRVFQLNTAGSTPFAILGTDAVQAKRLEMGYVGVDSLGRHYHQPAFPHWRIALPIIAQAYHQRVHTFAKALTSS